MRYVFIIMLQVLLALSCNVRAKSKPANILTELDRSLNNKNHYEQQKQHKIHALYIKVRALKNKNELYKANITLYDEYKSYQYDSAYMYANMSLRLATELREPDYQVESHCAIAFCLLSAGLYKEAFGEINGINLHNTTADYRKKYYQMISRLYYDMADYNHAEPYQGDYVRSGNTYTDSLLTYLKPQSAEWWYAVGIRQMKNRQYKAAVKSFEIWLKLPHLTIHDKAIVTSSLGWIYWQFNNKQQAIKYLAQAAIYDNESATKETTALRILAGNLYELGDMNHAKLYVQSSLDDANFYGSRQRKIEIGNILPIIEQNRFTIIREQRNAMIITTIISVVLLIVLLAGTLIIRKQMKKLKSARRIIMERNSSLQLSNDKLQESDKIKDEYIGKTFYINAEYINKVEKLYRSIDRKITTRQYEDLRTSLKESTLNTERKNMYDDFDETFLKLFPTFIEKYNALFEITEQKTTNSDSLTTEMRIFALIRLGISDSERIANFLDKSVHTINTYKTRVKNKSVVDNEVFEQYIMSI